ncbi:MAG: aldo/keto reductase [Microlunatus sp.]|nr:aldo/keto reductase [Microlunatus sp.]
MTTLGGTDLAVSRLCLGGNVFGWTLDEPGAFDVLDAFVAAGGNFIDTAEDYAVWVPGNSGGESETILGRWMAERGNRDRVVLATKVSTRPGRERLTGQAIRAAADDSLRRLQTDYIDLYYAHHDDLHTPLEETLEGFDRLVREGKVRHIGASNFTAKRLAEALRISGAEGLARYVALQPHYNLMERDHYEGELAGLCAQEGIACIPYWSLAQGFLTGKYRLGGPAVDSARAGMISGYLDERGMRVLAALDDIADAHAVSVAAVALAWLSAQPTVLAPVASARTVDQLVDVCAMTNLTLSPPELERLSSAATPAP